MAEVKTSKHSYKCPKCKKKVYLIREKKKDQHQRERIYSCFHKEIVGREDKREGSEVRFPVSSDNRELYPFQKAGVRFIEDNAAGCGLILDQQGLGKTIQTYAWIKRNQTKVLPLVIFCKANTKYQWFAEGFRWLGAELLPWIVETPMDAEYSSKIYIISHDLARKVVTKLKGRIKSIVVDEIQHIKDPSTLRTFSIREIAKDCKFRIGLSGTPIKNRGREFYPALNMVRPDLYPTEQNFVNRWVGSYYDTHAKKMREGGIRNLEAFQEYGKNVFIRRTRTEVLPDLPTVDRQFHKVDMADESKAAYLKAYDEFEENYNPGEKGFSAYTNILAYIARMRHVTGIAKADFVVDYVKEFLEDYDSKIVIFRHHDIAAKLVNQKLKAAGIDCISLTTKNVAEAQTEFNKKGGKRVLLASTLTAGEALNLQYQCNTCVMMERQWNAANEEQAESRFTRPDALESEDKKVLAAYIIALGTIDEWLTALIEDKRKISNIDKQADHTAQANIVLELADLLLAKGRPSWKLHG